ncbi:MAG TPA: S8 family serine peptidase [Actinomycetota bacterium]|nr:S8 family serine peptidase [Actinomycetota bacterium]
MAPHSSFRRFSSALVVVGALAFSLPTANAAPAHRALIDPALRRSEQLVNGRASAIVHVAPSATLADGVAAAEGFGLTTGTTYPAIDVFVAYGTPDSFSTLASVPAIEYIEANAPIRLQTDSSHQATRGQNLLDGDVTLGDGTIIDGSGVGVAVVDSGVDGTHPDLASRMGGNVKMVCSVPIGGSATQVTPFEQCRGPKTAVPLADTDTTSAGGHGTHVAGIVAGDGTFSDGLYHGAAPGASLYGVSSGTFLTVENALDGLAWVLENHDQVSPAIKVVNNSWGSVYAAYDPDNGVFHKATWKLQEALVADGVTVVMAAGNSYGSGFRATTTAECINPTPGIICVANYFDRNTGTRDGGEINGSSSRGTWEDPRSWPDITAPGTAITAACRAHLPVCRLVDESAGANENYATLTGTSMAAPNVAGIVAQLYQANPQLMPAEVENLLEDTAYKFAWGSPYGRFVDAGNPDNSSSFEKGHGMVDAVAVVRVALGLDSAPGPSTFPPGSPQLPIAEDSGIALHWNFTSVTQEEFTSRCTYDETFVTQSLDAHVFEVPEDIRDKELRVRIGGTNPIPFYDVSALFFDEACQPLGGLAQGGDEDGPVPAGTRYVLVTPGILAYVTEIFIEYYDQTPPPPDPIGTLLSLVTQGTGSKTLAVATLTAADGTGVAGKTVAFFADGASIGTAVTNEQGRASVSVPPSYRGSKTRFGSCFAGDAGYTGSAAGTGSTC